MARLELGADGMVRFDGRIIAEIAYFDQEFADIIEAADGAFIHLNHLRVMHEMPVGYNKDSYEYSVQGAILEKAGWWK